MTPTEQLARPRSAVSAYLDAGDRQEANARRIQQAEEGLAAELQRAIDTNGWVQIICGPLDRLERRHIAELFSDEMGADELCALMLNALAHSNCELVKAARKCFVDRVVAAHGADLVTFGVDQ